MRYRNNVELERYQIRYKRDAEPHGTNMELVFRIYNISYKALRCTKKADIVVFLTAHNPFNSLPWRDDKVLLDFCGIYKK